jgi:four helix bundle protein
VRKHHQLRAWQEAVALVTEVYKLTAAFPRDEVYALTSQMRRSAISVPSNIAEGAARTTDKEFLQFLSIARGSLSELETQIIIARNLGYLGADQQVSGKIDALFGLLGGLIKSIQQRTK